MNAGVPAMDELLRRARQGDRDALGELLEDHRAHLRVLADRQLGGRIATRVDASDIVQQTFLEAHRAFGDFRGASSPELAAWLRRILDHNVAGAIRDHAMLKKRSVGQERRLDDSQGSDAALRDNLPAGQSSPSQRTVRGEEAARLLGAIESLPADQREAVRMRHLEGRSLAEIARHLKRTHSAVASLIKRGMMALRREFSEK